MSEFGFSASPDCGAPVERKNGDALSAVLVTDPGPQEPSDEFVDVVIPRLAEAMGAAFKEAHRRASADQDTVNVLAAEVPRISAELASLRGDTDSIRQMATRLSASQDAMRTLLAEADAASRQQRDAYAQLSADVRRLQTAQEQERIRQASAAVGLAEELRRLDLRTQEQANTIGRQLDADTAEKARLTERLETLSEALKARVDVVVQLHAAFSRLEEAQRSLDKRLGEQSESLRSLQTATQEQARRWSRLFSLLQETQAPPEGPEAPTARAA